MDLEKELKLPEKLYKPDWSADVDESEPSHEPESFSASIVLRLFGMDAAFSNVNGEHLRSFLKGVPSKLPEIADTLKNGWEVEVSKAYVLTGSLIIPTIVGIPVSLNSTLMIKTEFESLIKAQLSPSILENKKLELKSLSKMSINGAISIIPKIYISAHVRVGCDVTFMRTQTVLYSSVKSMWKDEPFTTTFSYDGERKTASVKVSMPETTKMIVNATVVPVNMISVPVAMSRSKHIVQCREISNNLAGAKNTSIAKIKVN